MARMYPVCICFVTSLTQRDRGIFTRSALFVVSHIEIRKIPIFQINTRDSAFEKHTVKLPDTEGNLFEAYPLSVYWDLFLKGNFELNIFRFGVHYSFYMSSRSIAADNYLLI